MKRSKDKVWMFYQDGRESQQYNGCLTSPRIRLVYPNGHVEWSTLNTFPSFEEFAFNAPPCWMEEFIPSNRKEALAYISMFDKDNGFPEQIFIGEL